MACGQAGGGDGLAVALLLLAGDVKTDALGHLGELLLQDLLRQLENQVPTFARHHAAQHQQVAEVVEIGVVGDGVAEPDADGLVDLARAVVARRHQLLHPLELGGKRHLRWKIDARRLEQSPHGLLREVLHAHAAVARPLIGGRVRRGNPRARMPARSATW